MNEDFKNGWMMINGDKAEPIPDDLWSVPSKEEEEKIIKGMVEYMKKEIDKQIENELDNTEDTIINQMLLVRYNIDALKFGTYIDEFRHKEIIKSYDILTDMVFKYIEKLKQIEND